MNLDKWPVGKVETFQNMSNNLVNAYWEANLPKNFQKPAQNASTSEVTRFLTEKYVNKKWVDTSMKYDPLYLFENKKSRFEKFVKRVMGDTAQAESSEEEEKPVSRTKRDRGQKKLDAAPSKQAAAAAASV